MLPLNCNFSGLGWWILDFSKPVGQGGFGAHSEARLVSQFMQTKFLCLTMSQNSTIFSVSYYRDCRSYNVWCPMSVYYKPRIGCLSLITIWQIRPSFFEIQIMMSKSVQCLIKSVNMAWQFYKLSWSCKTVVFLQYLAYKYSFWYFRVILYSSCNFSWESKQRANCL